MKFWLAKADPKRGNNLSSFLKKGRKDRQWHDPVDQTKKGAQPGDGLFLYSSSPHQRVMGLGLMVDPLIGQDETYFYFGVNYLTDPLPNPLQSTEIEADPLFHPNPERHICFKPGPVMTRYPLTYEEARRLSEMILAKNPEVEGLREVLSGWFSGLDAYPEENEVEALEFPEGKQVYAVHVRTERSAKSAKLAKDKHKEKHGDRLPCSVCHFDFYETYGEVGEDFAEVHHAIPLSEYKKLSKTKTKPEDLVVVCSNCHRMLHRRKPWLVAEDLIKLLAKKTKKTSR